MARPQSKQEKRIEIRPIQSEEVMLTIIGDTRLIVQKFSEKNKRQIAHRQSQEAKVNEAREPKDPTEFFEAARHRLSDGRDGFPAGGISATAVKAYQRHVDKMGGPTLRGAFYVLPNDEETNLVAIEYEGGENGGPAIREDAMRNSGRVADLRYRPDYGTRWSMTFAVRYRPDIIDLESLVNALNDGGASVGLGEGRPERSTLGWGRFHVAAEGETR
jgi:hypothetical protein